MHTDWMRRARPTPAVTSITNGARFLLALSWLFPTMSHAEVTSAISLEQPPSLQFADAHPAANDGKPGFDTGTGAVAGSQRIDLPQAINFALQQNRNLALARFDLHSAEIGIEDAEAEFRVSVRPEISLNTEDGGDSSIYALRVSRKLRVGTQLDARVASEKVLGLTRQESAALEISQPLFRNAGRLVNEEPIVLAQSALAATRRRFQQQKTDLMLEVVRSYENILRLQQQLKADEQALQRATALARSTKAKEALGRATRVDTLRVALQRGQAMSRLENGRESLASARQAFAELLGFSTSKVFDLRTTKLLEVKNTEPERAMKIAFANRLDYAQTLQDHADSRRGVRIARKGLFPDLRVVGRYQRNSDDLTLNDGTQTDRDTWFLGLTADTDFNRVLERNAVRRASLGESAALQRVSTIQLAIEREVQQAILAYNRTHAELKILERNLEYAGARLQLARRLFELGRGDNFSVTDAEDAFLQAESNLLIGRSRASVTGYELLRTLGTLLDVPVELKPQQW